MGEMRLLCPDQDKSLAADVFYSSRRFILKERTLPFLLFFSKCIDSSARKDRVDVSLGKKTNVLESFALGTNLLENIVRHAEPEWPREFDSWKYGIRGYMRHYQD